jgi:hypothetical protein
LAADIEPRIAPDEPICVEDVTAITGLRAGIDSRRSTASRQVFSGYRDPL